MTEPRSAAIEAAQIITPRFITKLVELNPTFSARVAIEENLRADIVSAIERARQEGWDAGRDAAAQFADLYAEENIVMAGDTILADPVLRGDATTEADFEKSDRLQIEGCVHSAQHHAGKQLATAIRALTPPSLGGEG